MSKKMKKTGNQENILLLGLLHTTKSTKLRRSSLLTTPIRQSTSRGCLLQVGQLKLSTFFTPICYGFVGQFASSVDIILIDIARRAVPLR